MKKPICYLVAMFVLLQVACKSKQISTQTVAYHGYSVECIDKSMDGKLTLRVSASGRNRAHAIEQAEKKAVYEVTFQGIEAGNSIGNVYPIVDEANARKKYEDYFDKFFMDGGAYAKYVTVKDQKRMAMEKFQGNGTETYSIIVVVNRSALRQRYTNDHIINN